MHKCTYAFDRSLLLWGQIHKLCPDKISKRVKVNRLRGHTQQLRELLRMLRKNLHQRRVVQRDLLQDALDRLGVLLHQLANLLDLRVVLDRGDVDVACRIDGHRDALLAALWWLLGARATRLLLLLRQLEEVLVLSGARLCLRELVDGYRGGRCSRSSTTRGNRCSGGGSGRRLTLPSVRDL